MRAAGLRVWHCSDACYVRALTVRIMNASGLADVHPLHPALMLLRASGLVRPDFSGRVRHVNRLIREVQ